jgi:hypothetical protein
MADNRRASTYLLSLPERVIRSAAGLAAGLVHELTDVAVPDFLRRTHLYQSLVDGTLRFLIEAVGEVKDVYPSGDALAENFLMRRTAGNGIELVGILTFHASPVWVLAALADLSGAGRQVIQEIAASLQREGLLESGTTFTNVDQLLNGLEQSAGRAAKTINLPPLDVGELRREWESIRKSVAEIRSPNLPSREQIRGQWVELQREAERQNRSVFEMSSLLALSAVREVPNQLVWFGHSAVLAAETAGRMVAGALLTHYSETLGEIHRIGYLRYWIREFRPYLKAAAMQFSPEHGSLTQRLLKSREEA